MHKLFFLLFVCGCGQAVSSTGSYLIDKRCIDEVQYLTTTTVQGISGITVQVDQDGNPVKCPVITP